MVPPTAVNNRTPRSAGGQMGAPSHPGPGKLAPGRSRPGPTCKHPRARPGAAQLAIGAIQQMPLRPGEIIPGVVLSSCRGGQKVRMPRGRGPRECAPVESAGSHATGKITPVSRCCIANSAQAPVAELPELRASPLLCKRSYLPEF